MFALEEGGLSYPWSSGAIISSFSVGGVGLIAFLSWEWFVSPRNDHQKSILPLFPMKLTRQRIISFTFMYVIAPVTRLELICFLLAKLTSQNRASCRVSVPSHRRIPSAEIPNNARIVSSGSWYPHAPAPATIRHGVGLGWHTLSEAEYQLPSPDSLIESASHWPGADDYSVNQCKSNLFFDLWVSDHSRSRFRLVIELIGNCRPDRSQTR